MDQINFRNHNYIGKGHSPPQNQQEGPELWIHMTIFQ